MIPDAKIEIRAARDATIPGMSSKVNGSARPDPDDLLVVHVDRKAGPCRACGSENVVAIRVSEEDSPLWVRVCADCDEHVWSLDD